MTTLAGRYELGAQIDRGGMAVVYRATDTVLHRPVAVKVLAGVFARDDAFVQRFEREARHAARLSHPNVVRVFDAGSEGDTHFLVMELIDGTTLARVIADEAPLEPARAAHIAAEVAAALAAAHAQGIVHRDVKPANVLITPSAAVKVADFGIARAADATKITQTGALLGTAAYVSPEQAAGLPATPRSDLYALGCVLYEMLTRRKPFASDSAVATLQRHINDAAVPPSSIVRVPGALDRVVLSCLAKDPQDRPGSATELATALRRSSAVDRPDDTLVMQTVEEPTVEDPTLAIPARAPSAPASPRERPARRAEGWRRWWSSPGTILVGGLVLVALLVVAIVGATGGRDLRPDGRGQTRDRASRPTATASAATSVEAAYTLLLGGIAEETGSGGLEEKAAEDLRHRAEEIGDKLAEDEYEEVAEEIAGFAEELQEGVDAGEISSASGENLTRLLRVLVEAIVARLQEDAGDEE